MKKDDLRKEVLPFSSKKKPSREGTVRRCKTLHRAEKRFTNVCSYLSFALNRFWTNVGAKFLAADLLMHVSGQFLRGLQPPFLSLMKEKEQKKIKASGTPAKFLAADLLMQVPGKFFRGLQPPTPFHLNTYLTLTPKLRPGRGRLNSLRTRASVRFLILAERKRLLLKKLCSKPRSTVVLRGIRR